MVIGCAVLAAAALSWPQVPFDRWGYASGVTIYPWWTWMVVAAIGGAGAVLLLAPAGAADRPLRAGAAGVALVLGGELAGTGIVAARHWQPAQGMGGYPGETATLERLAVLVAVTGLVTAAAAVLQLVSDRAFARPASVPQAVVTAAVGVGIIAVLPILMLEGQGRELTSWGAAGLIYAGPWGLAVATSAWLEQTAAVAVQVTVAGGAVVAAIGPQMTDLLLADDQRFVVVALAVVTVTIMSLRRSATDS